METGTRNFRSAGAIVMADLRVRIGELALSNPVMPASGTFAEGLAQIVPFDRLGAIVTKTITAELRGGNPTPRVAEVESGMLNSIGIPSKGADYFIEKILPFYTGFRTPLVVSISAPTAEAFAELARRMDRPGVTAIEANISCPNIEEDGKAFAMDVRSTEAVVRGLRGATKLPLWVKLTPNASDVSTVARAAENAGADALVVANTILAMSINVETFRPKLGNIMGGLSGAAVKPIIVRMTYQCARAVRIPVIGCGGISTAHDAVEYMLAGATAVQVGTATFLRPTAMIDIIDGITAYCERKGISRVADLTGAVIDTNLAVDELEAVS
jgi:dihydroorotate dehydrogenase (NAD+) catalytic subunit